MGISPDDQTRQAVKSDIAADLTGVNGPGTNRTALEQEVRDTLITQRTEELTRLYQTPAYQARWRQFMYLMADFFAEELTMRHTADDLPRGEVRAELMATMVKSSELALANPGKMAGVIAAEEWETQQQRIERLNKLVISPAPGVVIPTELVEEIKLIISNVSETQVFKDEIVDRLTKKALECGIENATSLEDRFEAIRALLPSEQDWRRFNQGLEVKSLEFFSKMAVIGDQCQHAADVSVSLMSKFGVRNFDLFCSLSRIEVEELATKIYSQ